MADPFELWRLMWSIAISSGLEQLAEAVPGAATAARPPVADAIELSAFPTLGRVRIELPTMALLEQREPSRAKLPPVLIVAPYAVHDASIADFTPGHSLAQTLAGAGASSVALTFWKSATAEMRDYGIDAYLSDECSDRRSRRPRVSRPDCARAGGSPPLMPRASPGKSRGWSWRARRSIRAPPSRASRGRSPPSARDGREPCRHNRRPDLRGAVPCPVVAAHGG